MGYNMTMIDRVFSMKKDFDTKALTAIQKLCIEKKNKGGSFAWVSNDEVINARTVYEAFEAWGWALGTETQPDGSKVIDIYCNNEKLGDDYEFFLAIAPYVRKGSWIEMHGEDGCRWKWEFDGKTCKEKTAKITY